MRKAIFSSLKVPSSTNKPENVFKQKIAKK